MMCSQVFNKWGWFFIQTLYHILSCVAKFSINESVFYSNLVSMLTCLSDGANSFSRNIILPVSWLFRKIFHNKPTVWVYWLLSTWFYWKFAFHSTKAYLTFLCFYRCVIVMLPFWRCDVTYPLITLERNLNLSLGFRRLLRIWYAEINWRTPGVICFLIPPEPMWEVRLIF